MEDFATECFATLITQNADRFAFPKLNKSVKSLLASDLSDF
jgi:hypothetical protein